MMMMTMMMMMVAAAEPAPLCTAFDKNGQVLMVDEVMYEVIRSTLIFFFLVLSSFVNLRLH
jgi:hypothetical protein